MIGFLFGCAVVWALWGATLVFDHEPPPRYPVVDGQIINWPFPRGQTAAMNIIVDTCSDHVAIEMQGDTLHVYFTLVDASADTIARQRWDLGED